MITGTQYGETATILLVIVTALCLIVSMPGSAEAKSIYLVTNHHASLFDAWGINPDGTAYYQATYTLMVATDPSGIGIDNDDDTIFITSEFSGGIEILDPVTLTYKGASSGPSNLAGIDCDDANDIVYSVYRSTNDLYAYDFDPDAATPLTLKSGYPIDLPNCSGAFGISFDDRNNILWVADSAAGVARAYDVTTWAEVTNFTPSHKPVDIVIDGRRQIVYTVSMHFGASTPGTGSTLLSKYDLGTGTETVVDMGHEGVGVAVDESSVVFRICS